MSVQTESFVGVSDKSDLDQKKEEDEKKHKDGNKNSRCCISLTVTALNFLLSLPNQTPAIAALRKSCPYFLTFAKRFSLSILWAVLFVVIAAAHILLCEGVERIMKAGDG